MRSLHHRQGSSCIETQACRQGPVKNCRQSPSPDQTAAKFHPMNQLQKNKKLSRGTTWPWTDAVIFPRHRFAAKVVSHTPSYGALLLVNALIGPFALPAGILRWCRIMLCSYHDKDENQRLDGHWCDDSGVELQFGSSGQSAR